MGESVLMITLHWAVGQAAMVGDKLKITAHRCPDRSESLEVAIDRKAFKVDGISTQIFPESRPKWCIHLGKEADFHLEFRKAGLENFQQIWRGDSDSSDADVAQLIHQPHETLLPGTRPLVVSLTRTIQEVIELDPMPLKRGHITAQGRHVERSSHITGPSPTHEIAGQLAVNFRHRIAGKLRDNPAIVVGWYREFHGTMVENIGLSPRLAAAQKFVRKFV
jgi:hypothetical protein